MDVRDVLKIHMAITEDVIMVTEAGPLDEPGPAIVHVSPAFERMTGYPAGYAVGRSPRFLQGPGTDRATLAVVRDALENRRPVKVDLLNYRRDGSGFWIELTIHPVLDEDGSCRYFHSVLHDITDRKRVETAFRQSEARFRAVAELLPMAVVITRETDGRILYGNPWLARFYGIDLESLPDQSILSIYANPEEREALRAALRENEIVEDAEFEGQKPDGTPATAQISARRIVYDGEEALLVVGRDISERKRIERRLLDAERQAREAQRKAEAAALARSQFFAAASHDLRQPYQAVRLLLQVLTDRLTEPGQHEVARKLADAMDAGGGLLNALLDVATLEAGTVRPKPVDMPVEHLLDRLACEVEPQAGARGLRFRLVRCKALVRSDPILLQRMLSNLLSNALRYTPAGSVLLGCRRRADMLRIEIWDTGIGIPEHSLDAVFEDFVQLGNPERDRTRGLGLGLSIVARMARLLDHGVDVRSTPGRGSVFAVEVPLARSRAEDPPPAPAPGTGEPAPAGMTVVVVDDDPIVLESLSLLVESWDMAALPARSLHDLGEALRTVPDPPGLIVADYRLQGETTGADAVALVRRHYGVAVPAIVLTGDTHPERLREAAAKDYRLLHKPIGPEALKTEIGRLLATS